MSEESISIADFANATKLVVSVSETFTGRLRWNDGRLEQEVQTQEWGLNTHNVTVEWRVVPSTD